MRRRGTTSQDTNAKPTPPIANLPRAPTAPTVARPIGSPSVELNPQSPEVLEKLERLDDLVYEAISGRSDTVDQLRAAWPTLLAELGESLLAESREQYLRYAMSIWEECVNEDGIRDPSRAIQALDVLSILFSDAT